MKIKLTPLNIVSALAILIAFYFFFMAKQSPANDVYLSNYWIGGLSLITMLACFIVDQVFRKMILSLGRLWVIELALISLTVIFTLVLHFITE